MLRVTLLIVAAIICVASASAANGSSDSAKDGVHEEQWAEADTFDSSSKAGVCTKNAPSNKGKGCNVEADCGNTAGTGVFCIAKGDYTGRRRRKGGVCAPNSPKNAGKPCYNLEATCGNYQAGVYFCQA